MRPIRIVSETRERSLASLDALHEHAIAQAERIFAAEHGVPFRWFFFTPEKRLVVIDTNWVGEDDKNDATAIVRMLILLLDVERYAHFGEAWVAVFDSGKGNKWDGRPAGEQEDREDVMFVSTWERAGGHRWTRYGVIHADTPKARLLARDDWEEGSMNHFGGRMGSLFGRLKHQSSERAVAEMKGLAAGMPISQVLEHLVAAYQTGPGMRRQQ